MTSSPHNPTGEYQPESTPGLPPVYAWSPRPIAALKWLLIDMLFPRGHLFIGLALVSWHDGSKESLLAQKERLRTQRRQTA